MDEELNKECMQVLRDPLITVEEVQGNVLRCTLRGAPERDRLRFTYPQEDIEGINEALAKGWTGNIVKGGGRYRIQCTAIGYTIVDRVNPQTGETVLGATDVALLNPKLVPLTDKASPEAFEKLRSMI